MSVNRFTHLSPQEFVDINPYQPLPLKEMMDLAILKEKKAEEGQAQFDLLYSDMQSKYQAIPEEEKKKQTRVNFYKDQVQGVLDKVNNDYSKAIIPLRSLRTKFLSDPELNAYHQTKLSDDLRQKQIVDNRKDYEGQEDLVYSLYKDSPRKSFLETGGTKEVAPGIWKPLEYKDPLPIYNDMNKSLKEEFPNWKTVSGKLNSYVDEKTGQVINEVLDANDPTQMSTAFMNSLVSNPKNHSLLRDLMKGRGPEYTNNYLSSQANGYANSLHEEKLRFQTHMLPKKDSENPFSHLNEFFPTQEDHNVSSSPSEYLKGTPLEGHENVEFLQNFGPAVYTKSGPGKTVETINDPDSGAEVNIQKYDKVVDVEKTAALQKPLMEFVASLSKYSPDDPLVLAYNKAMKDADGKVVPMQRDVYEAASSYYKNAQKIIHYKSPLKTLNPKTFIQQVPILGSDFEVKGEALGEKTYKTASSHLGAGWESRIKNVSLIPGEGGKWSLEVQTNQGMKEVVIRPSQEQKAFFRNSELIGSAIKKGSYGSTNLGVIQLSGSVGQTHLIITPVRNESKEYEPEAHIEQTWSLKQSEYYKKKAPDELKYGIENGVIRENSNGSLSFVFPISTVYNEDLNNWLSTLGKSYMKRADRKDFPISQEEPVNFETQDGNNEAE